MAHRSAAGLLSQEYVAAICELRQRDRARWLEFIRELGP